MKTKIASTSSSWEAGLPVCLRRWRSVGPPPDEFRRIGREELGRYPNVTVRDAKVEAITGTRGGSRIFL